MAQILNKFRIKQKLIIINLFTSGAALLLATGLLLLNEYVATRNALIDSITSQAEILANNSAAPLVFNDQEAAGETLRALRASSNIKWAILYDKEGKIFADYRRADATRETLPAAPVKDGHSFAGNHLNIFRSILLDGEILGSILIRSDLEKLDSMMMRAGAVAALTMAIVFAISFFLLMHLQKVITEPISHLEQLMRNISRNKDYSLTADVASEDEIGSLAICFNEMLEEIRKRDMQLQVEIYERKRAQEELVHKEKLAMLGRIAGNMGNELRNPLGVMKNAVFFLQTLMPDANETVREYLEIIGEEIDTSQRIISELLDFCSGRLPRTEPVVVHELIRRCRENCTLPENIKFQADLQETLPQVQVDPMQMGQVLKHLISNAVQAMPEGGVLRIAARQNSKFNADFIEISVADSGEGIAAENMKDLFQPLFTTKSRGIGLGLAICQKLTEANGGRIEVRSTPGKGTTFTILLPIKGQMK